MKQNEIYELLTAGESISLGFKDERVRSESLAREHFDISGVNRSSWEDLDQGKISYYFTNVYDLDYRSTEMEGLC